MLVLTRKVGEGIAIGDDVKIIVMQIKGKQVRLGIKADQKTSVHREEVYQRIQEENRSAATATTAGVDQVQGLIDGKPDEASEGNLSPTFKKRGEPSGSS